jgi:hypothetical protein
VLKDKVLTHIQVVSSRSGGLIVIDSMKTFTGHFCYTVKQKHDQFPDEIVALAPEEIAEESIIDEEIVDDDILDDA